MERRVGCPGSLRMEQGLPDVAGEAAESGTDLHDVVKRRLLANTQADLNAWQAEMDLLEPDDAAAVNFCIECAAPQIDPGRAEQTIAIPPLSIPSIPGDAFGTPDYVQGGQWEKCIVWDWKFGWGEPTPADDNLQLLALAVGVFLEFDASSVSVRLVDAFRRRVSEHTYTPEELDGAVVTLQGVVKACCHPNATLITGTWCKYCRAAANCPKLHGEANELATVEAAGEITVDQIARILDISERVEQVIGAIRQKAFAIIATGGSVPGWQLVEGRGNRAWSEPDDKRLGDKLAEIANKLGKPTGSIWTKPAVASPAAIEREWGKAKPVREALGELIIQKPGSPKLARR